MSEKYRPTKKERLEKLEEGLAWCSYHQKWEEKERFNKNRRNKTTGLQSSCKEAEAERIRNRRASDPEYAERERRRARGKYASDPEYAARKRQRARGKYASDPEYAARKRQRARERGATDAGKKAKRNKNLKNQRGITAEECGAILASQGHRCAVCGTTEPGGKHGWHTDHIHAYATGDSAGVRGVLCHRCNSDLISAIDAMLCAGIRLSEAFSSIKDYILHGQRRTQAVLAAMRAPSAQAA
jgi:hypothetical protein